MTTSPLTRLLTRLLTPLLLAVLVLSGCSESPGTSTDGSANADPLPGTRSGANAGQARVQRYVALGDSYTAAPFVPVTDVADGCFRSSANYPALVAKSLGVPVTDVSCVGARTRDFAGRQHPEVAPQLDAVTPETDLITIGIGGNDQQVFGRLTTECPAVRRRDPRGAPCEAAMRVDGKDALLTALNRTRRSLTSLLREVHHKAPDARVLVVGYPQLVDADHRCAKLPLARGDYAYGERISRALTQAVKGAATATGSGYVDLWAASRGHDICSADPWVNGAVTDQRRAARYHPFAVEQVAAAKLVLAAIED